MALRVPTAPQTSLGTQNVQIVQAPRATAASYGGIQGRQNTEIGVAGSRSSAVLDQSLMRIRAREDAAARAIEGSALSRELADDYRARLTGNGLVTSKQVQEYGQWLDTRVEEAVAKHGGSADSKNELRLRLYGQRDRLLDEASFAAVEATRAIGRQDQEERFRPIASGVTTDPGRLPDAYRQADALIEDYAGLYTPQEEVEIISRQRSQLAAAAVEGYMARGLYAEAADLAQMPGVVEAMTPEQQSNLQQRLIQARERENAQWNAYQGNLRVAADALLGRGSSPDALPLWARVQAAGITPPTPQEGPRAQTDVGKAIQDRAMFVRQYGEDSPQVRYFDEALDTTERDLTNESGIRKEFTSQSKDFVQVRDSFGRIQAATADPSPAGDLALIFNYMKMLDPGSTVRESEFAAAAAAGSFGQQLQAAAERYISGERLTPEMRADFVGQAQNLLQTQLQAQIGLEEEYARLARDAGVAPQSVIVDYVGNMRNLARTAAAGGASSSSNGSGTTQAASGQPLQYDLEGNPLGTAATATASAQPQTSSLIGPSSAAAAETQQRPQRATGGADGQIDPAIIDEVAAFAQSTPDAGQYFEAMADILDAADEAGQEMTLEEAFAQAKAAAGG